MKRNKTGLGKSNDKGKAVREISTHDEQQDEALHTRPSPNWPDNLLDAISEQGRRAAAKHAEACESKRYDINDPDSVNQLCGMTNRRMDEISADYLRESLSGEGTATLDGIDQSEPATQPSEPLVEQQDIHSEPTHVGTIDDRFEDGDGL